MRFIFLIITALAFLPSSVGAQVLDNGQAVPRGELSAANPAQLEVRLGGIDEELRKLRGRIEENEFQMRKLSENLEKFQRDADFRFNELSRSAGSVPSAAPSPAAATASPEGPTSGGDGVLRLPETPTAAEEKSLHFDTPREHYNYAFRLLNQTQYEQAAAAFEAFTQQYPKDPLVGNAYYWGGETYYIRRDFANSAENFRKGFEALPEGPKAADNLLKLAMSLGAMDREKEACTVLQQIVTKYRKNSASVADKADQEIKRVGCRPKQ